MGVSTVVTRFPTQNAVGACGPEWSSPVNAHADDGVNATASLSVSPQSRCNQWFGFGFDALIPEGSFIQLVQFIFEASVDTGGLGDVIASLNAIVGGVDQPPHGADLDVPLAVYTLDATADRAWSRSDLLDVNFKVLLQVDDQLTLARTVLLDYVKVEVTFDQPAQYWPELPDSALPLFGLNTRAKAWTELP